MHRVLIVEDSKLVASVIKKKIELILQYEVELAQTFEEAKKFLNEDKPDFLVCLAGLYLSDAPSGEIVDYVISKNIPTIVYTSEFSDDIREKIWSKKVVDYVYKESGLNLDYVIGLIRRVEKNRHIKALVVDDSQVFRARVSSLLEVHQYKIFQAGNGVEALKIFKDNPDIKLIITDYNMPEMDGLELIKEIRVNFSKDDISIIGMSGDNLLSAKFIKFGANDFLSKTFFTEEFYCRVNQNIEMIEYIQEIKESSNKDYLTNIYNRRYFYDVGQKLFENSRRKNFNIIVAMVDIDFFKKVNDTYGHDCGDIVIKKVANMLNRRFRDSDIVARIGGEEFCVLACNMDVVYIEDIFEKLRKKIEETEIETEKNIIKITISIGVCHKLMSSLDDMVKHADTLLYNAKESGRNKVVIE